MILPHGNPESKLDSAGMTQALGADTHYLGSSGITSVDDLLHRIAEDPDFIVHNLPDLISKLRVARLGSDAALAQSKKITRRKVRDHFPDICVGLAIMLALYGIFRDRTPVRAPVAVLVVVSKANGLGPFQPIRTDDVTLSNEPANPSAFTSAADVVGRYTTEYIPKGAILEQSKLSAGAKISNELDKRRFIRLKLQPSTVLAGFRAPVRLDLLAAPRDKDLAPLLLHEIYIVEFRVDTDGVPAVVALSPDDFDKLAPLIPRSDLFAVGPAH